MPKTTLGPRTIFYPLPAVLVGANVDAKPNFMAVAWSGIVNARPPMVSVSIRPVCHTLKGIRQNNTFSVNIPSVDLVEETDYCGIVSGAKTDKVSDCRFKVFRGKLLTAPLIEQCPVNLECHVVHTIDLGGHVMVVGRIEEIHVTDTCLTDGEPDVDKIRPFLYVPMAVNEYREFGRAIGKAFYSGKKLRSQRFGEKQPRSDSIDRTQSS